MTFWRWLISLLVWLSSEPRAVQLEHPRAAAAVSAARASMATDKPAPPAPTPPSPADCGCGQTCRNGVWKPDGRVEQICRCACERCKKQRQQGRIPDKCPDGKCPLPKG